MLLKLLVLAGAVYGGLALSVYLGQARLVYFPDRQLASNPAAAGLAYEDVHLATADGERLHGWWLPGRTADAPVVLFLHGNAGNISHRLDSLLVFHRLGLATLIVDYRGYGLSTGKPSEQGTYRDAEAAWGFLTETRGVAPDRIVVFGRSLGGAVAAWLGARVQPAALIVESCFTSAADLGAEIYPWMPVRWLARIRYDARSALAHARSPVLIAHSRDDEIIPFAHARALLAAVPGERELLEMRGDHNYGFVLTGQAYEDGLRRFLVAARVLPDPHRSAP